MTLNHASPDELLHGASPDAVPAAEVSHPVPEHPRPKPAVSRAKLLRTGGIALLVMTLAGSVATIVVMGQKISDLTIRVNSLDAAFRSGRIGQLASGVAALEGRVNAQQKTLATLSSVPDAIASAATDRAQLLTRVKQLTDVVGSGQQEVAQLTQRVSSNETALRQLAAAQESARQPIVAKPAAPEKSSTPPAAAAAKAAPVKKIHRSARIRRAATTAAPIVLTGIERRGGQTFAVVIPRGVSQISALRLLSPGDGLMGWTLRVVEGERAAVFVVNGREQRLEVQ